MGKLMMLKEWLTLDEAAIRLSATAAELVTQADILRFAIDNHIQLSVFTVDDIKVRDMDFEMEIIDGQKCFMLGQGAAEAYRVQGLWDLAAYGVGMEELERLYRQQKGLKPTRSLNMTGNGLYLHDPEKTTMLEVLRIDLKFKFVSKLPDAQSLAKSPLFVEPQNDLALNADNDVIGEIYSLLETGLNDHGPVIEQRLYSYYRETKFPDNCLIVLRLKELIAFESKHLGGSIKAELSPTERASSHLVIAALASMAGVDLNAPYKAVEVLRKAAASSGLELPASDETIVKFLKSPGKKKR